MAVDPVVGKQIVNRIGIGQFDPVTHYDARSNLIDLQPEAAPQTKKCNAIIPAVRSIRPIFKAWAASGVKPVVSHKTAWRTMRKVLNLSSDVNAKTIRYTISTWLYEFDWVPARQISEMLGHTNQGDELKRTSSIYAQYRPEKMGKVVKGIETIWLSVSRKIRKIAACDLLATDRQGGQSILQKTQ